MEREFCFGSTKVLALLPLGAQQLAWFFGTADTLRALAAAAPGVGLAALSGEDWNRDLSPWPAEKVFRGGEAFGGEAEQYLDFLCKIVIPGVESSLDFAPRKRLLLGYSLAGLFAVYALYRTSLFCAAASVSGSLWYDSFVDYAAQNRFAGNPERVYFSVGDREKQTRNQRMARVEDCTRQLAELMQARGVQARFEQNPGGHFYQPDTRMARALHWLTAE